MEVLLRLGASLVLGGLIGMERQWHHKHAGLKTHTLVSLGAAAVSLVSVLGLGPNSAPTQLAVGVVTGIGFIGGGVIMRRGGSIQGVTTAATLWATASLGLAVGGGFYFLGTGVAVATLVVQFGLRFADEWIDERAPVQSMEPSHRLALGYSPEVAAAVHGVVDRFTSRRGAAVYSSAEHRSAKECLWELELCLNQTNAGEIDALGKELRGTEGVFRVEWTRVPTDALD